MSKGLQQALRDLHRVERGSLEELVTDDPKGEAVVEGAVHAEAADGAVVASGDVEGNGVLFVRRIVDDVEAGRAAEHGTRVGGEWSFIETLRHLGFATAAWVGRMILGNPSPWHPLDLPWDEAPGWDGIPWDREVQPDLDEVLELRRERQTMVRDVIESLTDDQLASSVTCTEPGWPQLTDFPLREGLLIVLNEEWEHAGFAERDLAAH